MKIFYTYNILAGKFPAEAIQREYNALKLDTGLKETWLYEISPETIRYETMEGSEDDLLFGQILDDELRLAGLTAPILYSLSEENDEYGPGHCDEKLIASASEDGLREMSIDALIYQFSKNGRLHCLSDLLNTCSPW